MEIAIVLLGMVCVVLCIVCWRTEKKFANIVDMVTDLALHTTEREDWENATFEKHDRRIDGVQDAVKIAKAEVGEAKAQAAQLCVRTDELAKRMDDFDELASEAVKAQMDADRAWADGVRSITSYGDAVPRLNMESLKHE